MKIVKREDAQGLAVWDFYCDHPSAGRTCGTRLKGGMTRPFTSTGWSSKKLAEDRGRQHLQEHKTGEPMQELQEFRKEKGVLI